jgi:hypothetical protein
VQHLQQLEVLSLSGLNVQAVHSWVCAAGTALHPLGIARLTALTKLQVSECMIQIHGLQAITGSRSLEYCHYDSPAAPATAAQMCVELAAALPALQRLTSLTHTGRDCQKVVVQQTAGLPHLQELTLKGDLTLSAFQQLPQSLTKLVDEIQLCLVTTLFLSSLSSYPS